MRLGNQLWEHANFNNRLQPTEIGIGTGQAGTASVDRLKLSYAYGSTDNNGNVQSQTITVPTVGAVTGTTLNQCYTYDEFNRLKTAEEKTGATPCSGTTVWTQRFTYDQQGNRRFDTGTTIPVGFPNPAINGANNNRMNTEQGYLYDLAGNVTQDPAHGYTFDAEERQTKVDDGATGQYFYDGKGQRVKSITSAGTTIYVYDAMGRLIAEYTSGAATGSGTSYLTADVLGSPRVITAQDKSVKARHDYLAFGEEIAAGYGSRTAQQGYAADNLRQKFTGKERDVASGLDYFGARYYSSAVGRFTSVDPINVTLRRMLDPQLINLYSYSHNNPLAYVDPTGADSESEEEQRRKAQLEAQKKAELEKIAKLNEGQTYTVVLLGINSPEPNTLTAQAVLDPANADVLATEGFTGLTAANTSILPNDNGIWEASKLGESANKDQVSMAVELIQAAQEKGLNIQLITHSNGLKSANEILNAVADVKLSNSLVIADNTSKVSDLANVASHSSRFTLVGSNKDNRLSTPGAAHLRMEVTVGNLKYKYGFTGSNFAYKQIGKTEHGAQHYFKALRDGPVKVF